MERDCIRHFGGSQSANSIPHSIQYPELLLAAKHLCPNSPTRTQPVTLPDQSPNHPITRSDMPTLAYFITPHGFGHAARACAVMAAAQRRIPDLRWEIFTRTPDWFFAESLRGPYRLHPTETDVGLVQLDALRADLDATVERLAGLLPFSAGRVDPLAAQVQTLGCQAILCDIAPLGIAVAQAAGVPSVLLENFTWVDIYAEYVEECPALLPYTAQMAHWFAGADFHIQTSPVCNPSTNPTLTVPPVSRSPRTGRAEVRRLLAIPDDSPFLLITMGGCRF